MASKRVDLNSGLKFDSISAGKAYFEKILKETPLERHVTGQEFLDIGALYEAYCRITDWRLASPPAAFFPTHESKKGYTTRCFGVKYEDGTTDRFSLDRALSAVGK